MRAKTILIIRLIPLDAIVPIELQAKPFTAFDFNDSLFNYFAIFLCKVHLYTMGYLIHFFAFNCSEK